MDSFITVILLGLLALGHATPLILDEHHLNSLSTQAPSEETTSMNIMVANSTTAEEKVKAETEEGFTAEASAVEKDQDSRLERAPRHSDTSMSSTVEPRQSEAKSTAHPLNDMSDEGSGDETTTTTTTQMTTTISFIPTTEKSLNEFLNMNGEGFGESDEEMTTTRATASTRVTILNEPGSGDFTETTTATSTEVTTAAIPLPGKETVTTTMAPIIQQRIINNLSGSGKDVAVSPMTLKDPPTQMPKGHETPDWVIILGFLVGIAVLVLLCVGIATRDRWNRPNQFNSTIHNSASVQPADQEKATELDTFLCNELPPKENGKAEEYTVIPLEELPDSYSS